MDAASEDQARLSAPAGGAEVAWQWAELARQAPQAAMAARQSSLQSAGSVYSAGEQREEGRWQT